MTHISTNGGLFKKDAKSNVQYKLANHKKEYEKIFNPRHQNIIISRSYYNEMSAWFILLASMGRQLSGDRQNDRQCRFILTVNSFEMPEIPSTDTGLQ